MTGLPTAQAGAATSASVLPDLLARLPDVKIAVVGDHCVDAYWHVTETGEHSLETGLPVHHVQTQQYHLGGAGNVAAKLRSLGVGAVRAVGLHGRDPFAQVLIGLLDAAGVDRSGLVATDRATPTYVKPYLRDAELNRLDVTSTEALTPTELATLTARLRDSLAWADVVVVNQQLPGPAARQLLAVVRELAGADGDAALVLDARALDDPVPGALHKLNADEVAALLDRDTRAEHTDRAVCDDALELAGRSHAPAIVTRGDRGLIAAAGHEVHLVRGIEHIGETDPVGAGDTVTATVAALVAVQAELADVASIANAAAALTVRTVRGTGELDANQLIAAVRAPDLIYDPELAANPARAQNLDGTDIEIVVGHRRPSPVRHIIFDHDGTLSTLRQGWEQVMRPVMIDAITGGRTGDLAASTLAEVRDVVDHFIDRTTGIQTLVQMQGLVDLVRRFGFVPDAEVLDEHGYKARYNAALIAMVCERMDKLAAGHLAPEDFHVKNAVPLLEACARTGAVLHLASGTDEPDVIAEAAALGFDRFFEDRIHGAIGDVTVEAKRDVMDRILRGSDTDGAALVTFGDGPVEVRETRKRGGFAVGVCSDETRRHGFNLDKRARLIRGGAHVLVPDYGDLASVLQVCALTAPPMRVQITTEAER